MAYSIILVYFSAISEDPEDDIEEFRRLQSINQDFINNCGRANALNNPNYGRGQRLKDISWLAEHLSVSNAIFSLLRILPLSIY